MAVTYTSNSKQPQKNALYELQNKIDLASNPMAHSDKSLSAAMTEYLESGKAFCKYSTHYGLVRLQAAVEHMLPDNILLSKLNTAII